MNDTIATLIGTTLGLFVSGFVFGAGVILAGKLLGVV